MSTLNAPCKTIGIRIARLIYAGDVGAAREMAVGRNTWTVPEARAIIGASMTLPTFLSPVARRQIANEILGWSK